MNKDIQEDEFKTKSRDKVIIIEHCPYDVEESLGKNFYRCCCTYKNYCNHCSLMYHNGPNHMKTKFYVSPDEDTSCDICKFKYKQKFYICVCNGMDFKPLCEHCKEKCHSPKNLGHEAYLINGEFECICGKEKHVVKEQSVESSDADNQIQCFNSIFKFYYKEHKMYKSNIFDNGFVDRIFCWFCKNISFSYNNEELSEEDAKKAYCQLDKYSPLKIEAMFIKMKRGDEFFKHKNEQFHNFNMNFFLNVKMFKNDVIDFLHKTLTDVKEKKMAAKDVFSDYNFYNVMFAFNYTYDVLDDSNILIDTNKFLQITDIDFYLKLLEDHKEQSEYFYFYFHSKFAYAKFIYIMFFDNMFKKYNLLEFNCDEILNMNIFQRYLYMVNLKHFYLLSKPQENVIKECKDLLNFIDQYTLHLFNLMENAMKYYPEGVPYEILELFFRLCKKLAKRNLLTNKQRYVDLVIEIISKDLSKRQDNFNYKYLIYLYGTKSLFFIMLYINDVKIIKNLRETKSTDFTEAYVYQSDENDKFNDNLVKAFLWYGFSDSSVSDRYSKYVRKLGIYYTRGMDILLGKNNFYSKNILNLRFIPSTCIKYFIESGKEGEEFVLGLREIFEKDSEFRDFYDQINRISQNLIRINNEYFTNTSSDIVSVVNSYESKIVIILTEIRKLINDKFESIPPLNKKYLTVLNSEMGDENNRRKIEKMREVVKFTNFFQALNGCFYITVQNKIHFDRKCEMSENKTALLFFLYLLVKDDPQNLVLMLSTFNPKNFVLTFEESQPYFYNFLEGIMDELFSRLPEKGNEVHANFYLYDNYYFYVNVIIELIGLIIQYPDQQEEKLKSFRHLQTCFKLCRKPIKFLKWGESSIPELIENFNETYSSVLCSSYLKEAYYYYIEDLEKSNPPNAFYEQETLEKLLKNYLMYVNELYYSDFNFFGMVKHQYSEDDLFAPKLISNWLKNPYIPLLIRMEMREFHNNYFFYINYNSNSELFFNLYKTNRDNYEHRILRDLNINDKIPNLLGRLEKDERNAELDYNNFPKKNTYSKKDFLNCNPEIKYIEQLDAHCEDFINNTLKKINEVFDESYEIKPITRRKIALYKYYEKAIVYPVYNIVNNYLAYGRLLNGTNMHRIYEMVFEFLKATFIFYEKILLKPIVKDDIIDINEYEKFPVNQLEIYLIDIRVKKPAFFNKIKNYLKEFTDNKITYIDTERVCEIFDDVLKDVLPPTGKKVNPFGKKLAETLLGLEVNPIFKKIEDFHYSYKRRLKACKPGKKTFIKILEEKHDNHLNKLLMETLIINLINTDTYWINTDLVFKAQNLLNYTIFNNFAKHNCKLFQEVFMTYYKSRYMDLKFLINYFYYPSMVSECKKVFELPRRCIQNVVYKLNKNVTKLLQNLCEGHNKFFQNMLFSQKVFQTRYAQYGSTIYTPVKNKQYEEYEIEIRAHLTDKILSGGSLKNLDSLKDVNYYRNIELWNLFNMQKPIDKFLKEPSDEFNYLLNYYDNVWQIRHSFLNFVFLCLKMLISNANYPKTPNNLFYPKKKIRPPHSIEKLIELNTDLVIEMIQGCDLLKLNHIAFKLPSYSEETLKIESETFNLVHENFFFSKYLKEMTSMFMSDELIIQEDTIEVKLKLFTLVNTILNQSEQEQMDNISKILLHYFPINSLLNCVILYLKLVYFKYVKERASENEDDIVKTLDEEIIKNFHFSFKCSEELFEKYKSGKEVFEYPKFKLAAEIFLCITLFAEKFENADAKKVKELFGTPKEDDIKEKVDKSEVKINKNKTAPVENNKNENDSKIASISETESNILEEKRAALHFFSKLILQCEFLIRSGENLSSSVYDEETDLIKSEEYKKFRDGRKEEMFQEEDKDIVKQIYFVANPTCYDIPKEKIDAFFEKVDRSSTNTKLKEFIEEINLMHIEVSYKSIQSKPKDKKMMKELMNYDYRNTDVRNFKMSFIINMILLFSVKDKFIFGQWYYYLIILLSIYQIYFNVYYLYVYFKSRFSYSVLVEKERLGLREKEKLTLSEKIEVYIKRSIFGEEIYLFYFNIFICLCCIFSEKAFVLFPLQLLNAIKFVPTIKQIVMAFQMKYNQFLAMVSFLGILIFFYSMIGFYFMKSEFLMQFDDGVNWNACNTLLSCFVLYFNFGIRSGGGIGDITGVRPYSSSFFFWFKWIMDMIFYITVILIIMNMVNGIIISTFSQIREEEENRNRDKKDVCFICSRKRTQFEKKKKSFNSHLISEHNQEYYIYYLVTLLQTKETDMNSDQSYIYECLRSKDIAFFPVEKTVFLEADEDDDDADDE